MDPSSTAQSFLQAEEAALFRSLIGSLGEQAARARFEVAPNPCVGAAVLSDGVEVGRGIHEVWGGPHAEVQAFTAARASGVPPERWDTLVITLEPCSSQGKTPPCTEAILSTGIRRVVVGALDPDPRHRGKSLRLLQEAGVEAVLLRGSAPLPVVAPHFLVWTSPERIRRARPWAIAKWAQTRTGQLSPPEGVGEGRWISCPASRDEVQLLRSRVDAIVTGRETVRADDPRLTVRPPGDPSRAPLRVVLDTELRMSPGARLLQAPDPASAERGGPVHVFARAGADGARRRALEAAGATIHGTRPGDDGRTSLREVGTVLWSLGVRRLLLEAGPTLTKSWLKADFVDQLLVYTGNVNGGRGETLAAFLAPRSLEGVLHREVGEDSVLEAFVKR